MSIVLHIIALIAGLAVMMQDGWASPRIFIAGGSENIAIGPVQVSLRAHGRALPIFVHRGQYYVLGQNGLRYSIFIQNRTAQRYEIIASVDGRDVITGERDYSYRRRGYVLNPYRYVDITGFRTSQSEVAAFRFTSIADSYAVRRGSSWYKVGRIHVAVFGENRPLAYIPHRAPMEMLGSKRSPSGAGNSAAPSARQKSSPAAPPSADDRESTARGYRYEHRSRRIIRPPVGQQPNIGTAYGDRTYAPAEYTTFLRSSSYPSYTLTFHYNDCDGYRRSGICTHLCPCYRWYRPPLLQHQRPSSDGQRFAPPPTH